MEMGFGGGGKGRWDGLRGVYIGILSGITGEICVLFSVGGC